MTAPLLLVAASGLAREVLSVCEAQGVSVLGVVDDDPRLVGLGFATTSVLGTLDCVTAVPDASLLLCAGKGDVRRRLAARLASMGVGDDRFATLIDPSVHVPASCAIGPGGILLAGVVLTADVRLGRHVVCMPNVTLTHDDDLADYVTLTAGVSLGGGVRVGEAAYVGMNATVRERVVIGPDCVLGMGSVLLTDQPPRTVYAGIPARPITDTVTDTAAIDRE